MVDRGVAQTQGSALPEPAHEPCKQCRGYADVQEQGYFSQGARSWIEIGASVDFNATVYMDPAKENKKKGTD